MKTRVSVGSDLVARATAVDHFSEWHAQGDPNPEVRLYRGLIPLSKPAAGQQYTFEVDLDRCTGCKACVVACHSMNGLLEEESWRDVGTLTGETNSEPWLQTVTSACHHCAEPGCLEGCPVGAYEKDSATGIVRHLDDQCIGCRYCELKCPYGVPKYSETLGIVRKCDLCAGRLAVGQAPACVNACPSEAIRVRIVDIEEVLSQSGPGVRMLAGAFPSEYTKPTTRYVTAKSVPLEVRSSGESVPVRQAPHWPLVVMLQIDWAFGAAVNDPLRLMVLPETLLMPTVSTVPLGSRQVSCGLEPAGNVIDWSATTELVVADDTRPEMRVPWRS